MKLKYAKILILVLAVTLFSACWWESDRDRAIDFLTDYEWSGDLERNYGGRGVYSVFDFAIGRGESSESLFYISNNKRATTDLFRWRWFDDGFENTIELEYRDRHRSIEFLDEIFIDERRRELHAVHYKNERDFSDQRGGTPVIFQGIRR